MVDARPRVRVPRTASAGDIIEIKSIVSGHPMESGHRIDRDTAELIPRQIINHFVAYFEGQPIFNVDLFPSIASNPYIEFTVRVQESGTFHFEWYDDDGSVYEEDKTIEVT